MRLDRVIAEDREPRYVTLVNPQPEKGAAVFARIALELGRRRPEIPLLVVEGAGRPDGLAGLPVDLSGLTNLHRMANTPDPRDFYRVSRVVLMPSLWRESLGRVAVEAMANGIPVLASDRGALPETLGDAGFVLTIPDRYTSSSAAVPDRAEVAPWVASIERLWDDPAVRGKASCPGHGRGAAMGRRSDRRPVRERLSLPAFARLTNAQRGVTRSEGHGDPSASVGSRKKKRKKSLQPPNWSNKMRARDVL